MMTYMIRVATLVAMVTVTAAAALAQSTAGTPASPMLEVSGPTHFADGEIRGATAGWALKLNQSIEVYQASGKTLCESASATATKPADAGSGWRLTITPIKLGSEVVLGVSWQRLWERGETLNNGPKGSAFVTLLPGERILFDYITAGDLGAPAGPNQAVASRPGDPARPVVGNLKRCNAIGMGLQIGIPPVESRDIIEASLWLVRTLADGSERSVRQNVRVRAGASTEFFFDDEQIVLSLPKESSQPGPPVERRVRTFGSLRPIGLVSNGKIIMELVLAQQMAEPRPTDRMTGGSTTYELSAGPEEVVAFRVPQVSDNAGRLGERLSVRIQVKTISQPSVTIAQSKPTTAGRTDSAFITGDVSKPGVYPWVKGMTVLNLVAAAGGLLPSADRRVLIVSGTAKDERGQPLTYLVEFDDLIKGKNLAKNLVELQPGDTVIVRRAKGLTADELRAKLWAELKK